MSDSYRRQKHAAPTLINHKLQPIYKNDRKFFIRFLFTKFIISQT